MADYIKGTSSPSPVPVVPATSAQSEEPLQSTSSSTEAISGDSSAPAESKFVEEVRQEARNDAPAVNIATRPLSRTPPQQAAVDPAIAALQSMFPDYDEAILQSVLQSAGGNQDAAIDILLGMSDPNYKSEGIPAQPPMSQDELDEQLARRLMLEEQEQLERQGQYHQPGGPRRRNSRLDQGAPAQTSSTPGTASGEKDTMTEIQEQLSKAAEAGKKTIGTLFTKVRAKIQEFEQGRSAPQTTQWVGGYDPQAYSQQGYPQQAPYAPYYHQGSAPVPPQASYYDPNGSPLVASSQGLSLAATPAPAVKGYGASPIPIASPPPAAGSAPTAASPARTPTLPSSMVPPPASNTLIDGGKLGLLPKRPVSLIRDPPAGGSSHPQPRKSVDSDDALEYAENPFEDQKK